MKYVNFEEDEKCRKFLINECINAWKSASAYHLLCKLNLKKLTNAILNKKIKKKKGKRKESTTQLHKSLS